MLMHHVTTVPSPCPSGRAFNWETGEDVTTTPEAVALPSCTLSSDAAFAPLPCPGCQGSFPLWAWVEIDGRRVLTHDGNKICPADSAFGYLTCSDCLGAETVIDDDGSVSGTVGTKIPCVCTALDPAPVPLGVAA
ncbi:hypothetical protein [Streptomyces sp. YS-3]|uniref:hypothetical protein n=1 Tax=Streptomyces sp. YS-3 TaxID=3381352 RepID=UPI00386226AD